MMLRWRWWLLAGCNDLRLAIGGLEIRGLEIGVLKFRSWLQDLKVGVLLNSLDGGRGLPT